MNQDKSLEANDNLNESLKTSNVPQKETTVDLWSEEEIEPITDFVIADTTTDNDSETSTEIASPENKVQPKKKKNVDLDLDDWDFRNPPITEDLVESEQNTDLDITDESPSDELEIEPSQSFEFSTEETESQIGLEGLDQPDLASDDSESLELEAPETEINLEGLDQPGLASDNSEILELDEPDLALDDSESLELGEPEAEISLDGFDQSDLALDDSENLELEAPDLALDDSASLELDEPEAEISLDGFDQPDLALDDSESLELGEPEAEISLDGFDQSDLALDDSASLELDEPEAEISLDGFDQSDLALDDFDNLELEAPEAEINLEGLDQPDLALDDFDNLELGELELGEPVSIDEPKLDKLDGLLDLDTDLDSLVAESTTSLDALENSLDSDFKSVDLDSLLDSEPKAVTVPASPPPQPATATKESPSTSSSKTQAFDQTMRVSVRKLDNLNNLIGELVVKRNRLEDDQERLRRFLDNLLGHVQSLGEAGSRMHDMYERSLLEGALMASRQSRANSAVAVGGSNLASSEAPQEEGLDALEMDRFTGFHLLSQEIIELIVRVREAASDIQFVVDETDKVAQTFRQVTSQLQDGMNSSRMVAFGQTADRLPRAIRDISRKQKKQTKLHVEGKDVLIDKMIVEHLYNPMTHLVNNAISHGIEKPEDRLKKGKPEVGNIYIRAFIQGNQTVITVTDDGAGIDPEKVKEKAIEKNLITWATAQNLSDQQVYELLFHPGFSTKDQADDFAGRGVGMDVVNTDLKKIRGSISTESEIGKGTTFTVRLPLVLSICKALTCIDNNTKIAFPIDGVEDTKEYLPSDIQTNTNDVRCISWKNTLLPLRPLSSLLNYNRQIRRTGIYNANQNNDDIISVIILRSLDNLLAIEVDEVLAEQEIVIKQIDGPIPKPSGIAGATVLGDGTIMPIGDVLELIEIAQGKRTIEIGFNIFNSGDIRQSQDEVQQEPMVLVVDDSITVRELLSMSFNKLGYRVEQARDGQEAWDKLCGGLECDMIFSDIEMPRMNGLELLSNLHQDSKLKSIPVAMLTSRGADKHRKIANDLGAKAYLTKPYTEKDLMDVAQHLIEINRANKEAKSTNANLGKAKNRQSPTEFKDAPLVLIIDDSVTVRELLSMSFKKAGYRVEQARDGQEAWEKLRDGLECDIAFCDIEMPRMNGLELLSQLQQDQKLASLPIAMLTSRGAQKMRNIAASRGANGYFVKPYVEDELLKAAKRMMNGEMLIETASEQ
ncbi:response regulator [Pleurocapsales cyanobacterium LEGE 10410]|nr:response regulator [Pleurocapsales cyanobacterium LEGE 10410]